MNTESRPNIVIILIIMLILFAMLLMGLMVGMGILDIFTLKVVPGTGESSSGSRFEGFDFDYSKFPDFPDIPGLPDFPKLPGGIPGGDVSISTGDFFSDSNAGINADGSLRTEQTQEQADASAENILAIVTSGTTENMHLRYKHFGDFNGSGWYEYGENPLNIAAFKELQEPMRFTAYALKSSEFVQNVAEIKMFSEQQMLPYHSFASDVIPHSQTNGILEYSAKYYSYDHYAAENQVTWKSYWSLNYIKEDYERVVLGEEYLDTYNAETKQLLLNYAKNFGIVSKDQDDFVQMVAQCVKDSISYNKVYNWEDYKEGDNMIEYLLTGDKKEGVCAHYATVATLMFRSFGLPARYVLGLYSPVKADQQTVFSGDTAHAWVEVYLDDIGWVCVEVTEDPDEEDKNPDDKNVLSIITESEEKEFDGTPLVCKKYHITGGRLQANHRLIVTDFPSRTEVGSTENKPQTIVVYDKYNNDVTDQYEIETTFGFIVVTKPKLQIKTFDRTYTYDGMIHTDEYVDYPREVLAEGHTLNVKKGASLQYVGETTNSREIEIVDKDGNNVEDEYQISYNFGTLTVKPRPITIRSGSVAGYYTGEAIREETYTITKGSLLQYDELAVEFKSSPKEVGVYENLIECNIMSEGKDVTDQYQLNIDCGMITIRPAMLYIKTETAEKAYDGTPLHAYTVQASLFSNDYSLVLESGEPLTIDVPSIGEIVLTVTVKGSLIERGSTSNSVGSVTIVDKDGNDISGCFELRVTLGILIIY